MTAAPPDGPEAITPAWLGAALGRPVTGLALVEIGQDKGFTGARLWRARFEGGTAVVKLAPEEAGLRRAYAEANRREVQVYRDFGAGLPVPRCALARAAPRTGRSVLVLEDLGHQRQRPFAEGLRPAEARAAVAAMAEVHAAGRLRDLSALTGEELLTGAAFPARWARYEAALHDVLPRARLSARLRAMGDAMAADLPRLMQPWRAMPQTLVHRDIQCDNLFFGAEGRATLIDWQMAGRGVGAQDLGYFLIASLDPQTRRAEERDLVARYAARLGQDADAVWQAACSGVIWKLLVSVVVTVLSDHGSPAKRAWRAADLARLEAWLADHEVTPRMLAPPRALSGSPR